MMRIRRPVSVQTLQGQLASAELRVLDLQTVLDASNRENAALRDNIAAVCERNEVVYTEHQVAVTELMGLKNAADQLYVSKEDLEIEVHRLQQYNTELVAGRFHQVRDARLGF